MINLYLRVSIYITLLDVANDGYMYTKHVSNIPLYWIYYKHTQKKISSSLVLFISTASAERIRAHAITKTRLGDATRTMVTVAPFRAPLVRRGGRKRSDGLGEAAVNDSSPRAGRRGHISFCAMITARRPSTFSQIGRDRSRRDTHHNDDDNDDEGDGESAQGRPVARFQKFFTAVDWTSVWYIRGDAPSSWWSSQVECPIGYLPGSSWSLW